MLLTNSNCLAEPRDSRVLTSSPLNRRSVRECVPDGARMLPPKLYLVVFYQVSLLNPTGLTCSNFKKTFGSTSGKCLLYHITCPYPMGKF